MLKDDEWHKLDEISEKCELSEVKVENILKESFFDCLFLSIKVCLQVLNF